MFRAQRIIAAASAASWSVSIGLMFAPLADPGPTLAGFLRVASVNTGALAACLTTVAVTPFLLRGMFQTSVSDYVAAYLAGLARGQEVEPDEPTRLTVVR